MYVTNCEQSGCDVEGRAACHSRSKCHEWSSLYNRLQYKVVNVGCVYVTKDFG